MRDCEGMLIVFVTESEVPSEKEQITRPRNRIRYTKQWREKELKMFCLSSNIARDLPQC